MTDVTGAFRAHHTFAPQFAGTRSTTSSFGLTVNASFQVFAVTNRLVLVVDTPGTFTTGVGYALQADGSADEAYVEFDCSTQTEVWVTFRLKMSATGLTFWTDPGAGNFAYLVNLQGTFIADTFDIGDEVTYGGFWNGNGGGEFGSVPAPVADTWVDCECHYQQGGLSEFFVDGITVWSTTAVGNGTVTVFQLGVFGPFNQTPGAIAYFDDVKFGTSRGGSDLFADDFSSGNLDAWTTTVGDVSIATVPGAGGLTPDTPGGLG